MRLGGAEVTRELGTWQSWLTRGLASTFFNDTMPTLPQVRAGLEEV